MDQLKLGARPGGLLEVAGVGTGPQRLARTIQHRGMAGTSLPTMKLVSDIIGFGNEGALLAEGDVQVRPLEESPNLSAPHIPNASPVEVGSLHFMVTQKFIGPFR